ncbi:DNA endonuclease SmrA [Paraferrimonas sedimenticola]|uniref:DNA endonuclease SmrA n=1 Tax=Paraferrimonas sedimenticola TaxID=375674 RepID=UPI000BA962F0|nr:DNA endonuclease SmrA [Paraferrimonas sedimenticola]
MQNDDFDAFKAEMGDVQPLKSNNKVVNRVKSAPTEAQLARRNAATAEEQVNMLTDDIAMIPKVDPDDLLEYKKSGVQEGVFKNLRLGKYDVETRLDLHSMSVKQARHALLNFVQDCQKRNMRCVIINHGKGLNSKPVKGLMKSFIGHWLTQLPDVLAFHSAQRHHGGMGAVYVMLRKSAEKKTETREMHRKG